MAQQPRMAPRKKARWMVYCLLGSADGSEDGTAEGAALGPDDGALLGSADGSDVGTAEGTALGPVDGALLGVEDVARAVDFYFFNAATKPRLLGCPFAAPSFF